VFNRELPALQARRRLAPRLLFVGLAALLYLVPGLLPPRETQARRAGLVDKQLRDGEKPTPLTPAELAELGDPMFVLVLRDNANVTSLREVEDLIQPDADGRKIFVVSETIINPARDQNQVRRSVITFSGSNRGQVLDNNLMISVPFGQAQFPDNPSLVEVWGFDRARGRFNYYVLNGSPLSWKFRGSSEGADLLSANAREGTCLACHINGGPLMKELTRPWNNWHSDVSPATYLQPASSPDVRWRVAQSPRFKDRLDQAENLQVKIEAAIRQFNTRRVTGALERGPDGSEVIDAQGRAKVRQGRRLLRPLFETTEINLASSEQKSRLHPLPQVSAQGPDLPVVIPDSFFLNAQLIGQGGLGIARARQFSQVARVSPQEYRDLIAQTNTRLFRQPGDADFAWLVPEPSRIDNDMVDRLLRAGVVSQEFVAAVQAIDLETPVFSRQRASLLRFIPDEFLFRRLGGTTPPPPPSGPRDDLTEAVIAALQASNPSANSPAGRFLQLLRGIDLQNPDSPQNPRKILEARVNAYHDRVKAALESPQGRGAELRRLYQSALARRRELLAHPLLGRLDETGDGGLLPLPSQTRRPAARRGRGRR
jgi:hypothetical protein